MVLQNAPLEVSSVHLFPLENAEKHHTENFELVHLEPATPVLRRGQAFRVELRLQGRAYDPARDAVRLVFNFGPHPSVMRGTRGIALLNPRAQPKEKLRNWTATVAEAQPESLVVEVTSPPDAPVGIWELQVKTLFKEGSDAERLSKYEGDIYLLFNPWIPEDQTFLDNERLLEEYVLNDVGKIWVGPHTGTRGREWVFGQFDAVVLKATMYMLQRSRMKPQVRGDPVLLTRKISQMVNSNDADGGILEGNWSGDYDDGTAPAAWTGSVAILEEYLKNRSTVRYGQCWVFAGVVTTVCRALGIPSRPVSNLVSAHDANETLSVDRYYDEKNMPLEDDPLNPYGNDSIWNYHVWNEVWMARPDLPKGYGGWQAIDATPQETSDSLFQCGPASLEAIRNGAVGLNYDVPFLLAEVNADVMRWKRDVSGESDLGYERIDSNKYHIGRIILTKQPWIYDPNGDKDREDITNTYKPQEGTKEERLSLMNGVRSLERAKRFYQVPDVKSADVAFELEDIDKINIGEPFENKATEVRTVDVMLSSESIYYNGIKAHPIKQASGKFKINPNNKEKLRLKVHADEYLEKLVEYCNMKICAIATVVDTRYTWADEDDFLVIKPPITVKLPDTLKVNEAAVAKLSFKNPLKKTLTKCKIRLEAPGLIRTARPVVQYRDVKPLEDVTLEYEVTPIKEGNLKLIATFYSKELVDISGSATVDVVS
ncbi:Annulin [Gryllus bimaculatus]|nr:Annulin [Gryllus bimaculatus]